ncbi:MarR family transcriptional regulator [Secundilactobacillus paracollinoides]|uniref:MarR family transcriptional regulator n=1 Tax=Secundilactobacillus paracollinoides TaxID=240427 RepID=A0A1B2IVU7_9LACO|nr:MarR family winged helix-turn-helix transcriptional regulator [Secundilactobacillus paracollinoides]ANZ60345.1 MarR family transcriptional regulator [Secundilactobacillus paracollinoides]ANZ62667.1 MarR family transcriptional regulator [Secundilactobacillus paracollinoides]ANZ66173.1 MarR family transcriptional regulator [Secundilactobacillus paracollinoides]KRL75084.1 hypothetical protein FC17_GL002981 [Secundilactobacillus paracollinoides DSM 15502 = JCM 11969]
MASNFGVLIKRAANDQDKAMDAYARQFDLTGVQMSMIDFLGRRSNDIVLQRDIEAEFNIQRSTATVLLQRMERKGLVVRQSAASDARQKQVMLTQKAVELKQHVKDYIDQQQAKIEAQFSEEDLATFNQVLQFWIEENAK